MTKPADTPLLTVEGLTKRFGTRSACRDIDFSLWPGEVLGVVGESGSGKTTLLGCIAGHVTPTAGQVTECGSAFAFRALFLGQEDPAVGRRLITRWHDDLTIRRNALQRKSESPKVSPAAKALLTRRLRHVAADLDFVGELSSAYEDWAASSKATSSRSGKRRSAPPRADVQPDASRPFRRSTSPRAG